MAGQSDASIATRLVASLGRAGRPGRILAAEADRLRVQKRTALPRRRSAPTAEVAARLSRSLDITYRRIWSQAAEALDAETVPLGGSFLLIRGRQRETLVHRHLLMLDHPSTTALALDKPLVRELLTEAGLPTPDHVRTQDRAAAADFVAGSSGACVVKPAQQTSGGSGVTCGIRTQDDLLRAWVMADRWAKGVHVERQTPGHEYRLTFLDGQLIGAVRRRPPMVIGDGSRSVTELVAAENRNRVAAGAEDVCRLIDLDLDSELTLRYSGFTPGSVVPAGQKIAVKTAISDNGLRDNEVATELSPEFIADAAAAVRQVRLRLAGVDVVTPDPGRSLRAAGGTILEINATPGLHYHYQVAARSSVTPVAIPILQRLLAD